MGLHPTKIPISDLEERFISVELPSWKATGSPNPPRVITGRFGFWPVTRSRAERTSSGVARVSGVELMPCITHRSSFQYRDRGRTKGRSDITPRILSFIVLMRRSMNGSCEPEGCRMRSTGGSSEARKSEVDPKTDSLSVHTVEILMPL